MLNSIIVPHFGRIPSSSQKRIMQDTSIFRFDDLYEMQLYPPPEIRKSLARIFEWYRNTVFPSSRQQLDQFFEDRHREFLELQEPANLQERFLDNTYEPMKPSDLRMDFDREVCEAIGLDATQEQIAKLYEVMAKEIILTRRLIKD